MLLLTQNDRWGVLVIEVASNAGLEEIACCIGFPEGRLDLLCATLLRRLLYLPPPNRGSENATVARLRTSAQNAVCLRYSELQDLLVSDRRADVGSEGEQGGKEW